MYYMQLETFEVLGQCWCPVRLSRCRVLSDVNDDILLAEVLVQSSEWKFQIECSQVISTQRQNTVFIPEHPACPQQGLPLSSLAIAQVSFLLLWYFRYK